MKKTFNIGLLILKPFLILSFTNLISYIQQLFFDYWIFALELENDLIFVDLNILLVLIYFLIFNSMVIGFNSNDRFVQTKYLEYLKKTDKPSNIKFVLSTPFFYLEAVLFIIISVVFSNSYMHYYMSEVFLKNYEISDFQKNLYSVLIIIPLLIIVSFLARVVIAKKWIRGINGVVENIENSNIRRILDIIKYVFFALMLYCVGSMILVWFLPPFMAFQKVTKGMFVFILIFGIIIAILAIFAFFCVRALIKRKLFINKLKKYCKRNSLYLSNIEKPYSSILVSHSGFNFTVEKNGIKYDCKLLSSIFPGSQIILSDKGYYIKHNFIRVFKIQLFSREKDYKFTFESNNKKLLIVVPIPKNVFVSIRGSKPSPADTGERIGEYTLYNSTGFINSLDRNCL